MTKYFIAPDESMSLTLYYDTDDYPYWLLVVQHNKDLNFVMIRYFLDLYAI